MIIGAGPAGLTAAFELLTRTNIRPIVLEKSEYMGGISRTVNYKGNRIDIGGHRFFSKSDRVMTWWMKMLPIEPSAIDAVIQYHGMQRVVKGEAKTEANPDAVMLLRPRKSRIFYLRRFFDYPISLSKTTIENLGLVRTAKIGISYFQSVLFPVKPESNLEQFFINRFGKELYLSFFKSYTEKVWGVPCTEIDASWGVQRIKGLSVWAALVNAAKKLVQKPGNSNLKHKGETSLNEQFLYPKLGPGQMWEETARRVKEMGGEIRTGYTVKRIHTQGTKVTSVEAVNGETGAVEVFEGDYFFNTAPLQEVLRSFDVAPPANVLEVSDGLVYRDFITVGLLVNKLKIHDDTPQGKKLISDNWIYVQEADVVLGRIQVFNNWSESLIVDPSKIWLGLEYFCNTTDSLWKLTDAQMSKLACEELSKIGMIEVGDVIDTTVIRMEKTYPAYFGTFDRFGEIRTYLERYPNLFPVGRNGMHRYNNQDHSMLTAMMAVDNIIAGRTDKSNLWEVNTEMDYHEEAKAAKAG